MENSHELLMGLAPLDIVFDPVIFQRGSGLEFRCYDEDQAYYSRTCRLGFSPFSGSSATRFFGPDIIHKRVLSLFTP